MKTLACSLLLIASASIALAAPEVVTAAQVNGTWECKSGTFKILALGEQKLQIEFAGIHEIKLADGSRTANTGEGSGIALIEGRTAKFKPEGVDEKECLITLTFVGDRLEVKQEGYCGFGNNVTAAGKYHRTSTKKPKFGDG